MSKIKLINVDLKFIIEQLDDDNFVCNNLPDRKITVQKKEDIYIYTMIFRESGFAFEYKAKLINYPNRTILTTLEQIQYDLRSCFLNYSDEIYIQKMLDYEIKYKSFEFGCKRTDFFYHFFIYGRIGVANGTVIVERSYIYDHVNNDLYQSTYKIPKKVKDIFDFKDFTTSYFQFYESLSTDGLIIDICHLKHAEDKDIVLRYTDNNLSIYKDKGNVIKIFTGESVIVDELKSLMEKVVSEHPTDSLRKSLNKFNINQENLTIEDLQIIRMVKI